MNRSDFFKRLFVIPFSTYFLNAKSEIVPTVSKIQPLLDQVTPMPTPITSVTPSWTKERYISSTPTPSVTPSVSGTPPPNIKRIGEIGHEYVFIGVQKHDGWWYKEYSNGKEIARVSLRRSY